METPLKLIVQNSETSLPKGKRGVLSFPSPFLVPCSVTEHEDCFDIEFNMNDLTALEEVKALPFHERYRLLYNCAELDKLGREFIINLAPDNLYIDINLLPKLLRRDIGSTDHETFLSEYKALIGAVMEPRYSFKDYYNGGSDLYHKHKLLKDICGKDTVSGVAQALHEKYRKECENNRDHRTMVGKSQLLLYRILIPTLAAASIACAAFAGYLQFVRLPFEDKLIRGNNAYLNSDFLLVQDELSSIEVADLPYESKYILARSYVVSESLNSEQKETILTMLTPQVDAVYHDYWIELGRLNFDGAIDAAQRIGDNQLLLLAYIKYEAFLETDTQTMTGDEKAEKLSDLKGKIENLSGDIESAREELINSGGENRITSNESGSVSEVVIDSISESAIGSPTADKT